MFPRPLPASFVSVQAVLPPKKGEGDIGLDGTPLDLLPRLGSGEMGLAQQCHPVA